MQSSKYLSIQYPPDMINPGGEEVWCFPKMNLVLIRLKPGTKSELYFHLYTQESYSVLRGEARFFYGCENYYLRAGQSIVIAPPYDHMIFNDKDEDVIICAKLRIPWIPIKL